MTKFIKLFSLLLLLSLSMCAQVKKHILQYTTPVKSAEFSDTCWDDLKPLAESIGEKRIVMLGEQFHGDGEAMKLKSRIVRFLHQQMGFKVLLFESDYFSLNHGYDAFKNGRISFDSLLYLSVFSIWTGCQQMDELFQYIKESTTTGNELIINGMDNRGISGYGFRYLQPAIESFLRSARIPFVKASEYPYFLSVLRQSATLIFGKNKAAIDSMVQLLPIVIDQVSERPVARDHLNSSFYLNVLNGLLINYQLSLHYFYGNEYKLHRKDHPLHDYQLAENLQWLVTKKFPADKIIVWAHNEHIEKGEMRPHQSSGYNSMGYLFTRKPGMLRQSYILGATCYEGSGKMVGHPEATKTTRPSRNSIEAWLHGTGNQYAFSDLSHLNRIDSSARFIMRTYFNTESNQEWTKYYDGILYNNFAHPCIEKARNKLNGQQLSGQDPE